MMKGRSILTVLSFIILLSSFALAENSNQQPVTELIFDEKLLYPYGFESSIPKLHAYVTGQYWDAASYIQNEYADSVGEIQYSPGGKTFTLHSAYIDLTSDITKDFLVEIEFEIYHGGKSFKANNIRGLWHSSPLFNLSLGRQFVLLGSQEDVYYPPSKYRFFTWQPLLYEKFLRFTGWWDTGVKAYGQIPLGQTYVEYGVMKSNGPGNGTSLPWGSNGVMNKNGYVYEMFNNAARQNYDNNSNGPVSYRLGFAPLKGLLFRVEQMEGNYDAADKYGFNYLTSEMFFSKARLDSMIGYGQLKFDSPADKAPFIWPGGYVKQMSYYVVAGYKIIKNQKSVNYLQPVFRYEWLDPNIITQGTADQYKSYGQREAYNVGLNYSPWDHVVFRSAYKWQKELVGPKIKNNGFTLEALMDF